MSHTPTPSAQRLFFLDWLRIGAFALLILYHVGMYYVSWDWHVKSPFAGSALEPWMRLSSPWRLSLLFVVSGAAVSMMLRRGAGAGFVGSRSKRLLLPLLFGMAVIVPPQPYFEVVHKYGYAGGYWDFLQLYFTGYGGFCRGEACLILPTWNHLWFVAYLWVYCVALWALLRWRPRGLDEVAQRLPRWFAGAGVIVWPLVVLAVLRLTLAPRFPVTNALVDDWFNHAQYFVLFMLGAALARAPGLWMRLEQARWPALGIALIGWLTLVAFAALWGTPAKAPSAAPFAWRIAFASMQWCAIVALIGFAHRHLNADHRWRAYLTDAVFPVYILHQTLIVLLSQLLRPLAWSPSIEGPLLVLGTFVLSFAGYEAVRRVDLLRPWFGLASPSALANRVPRDVAPESAGRL